VPRERIYYIGAQRYFPGCTADTLCNSFIQAPGQRNIRRESQVHDRDTGILAERYSEPLRLIDIFQDIGKLAACYRVCLGSGCLPDHPQYIRREMDDGFSVCPEGGIGERGGDHGIIRCLHSYTLRRAG
jgi:hypothetical protein